MPPVLSRPSLAAALALLLATAAARADFDALSYNWTASPFAIQANGGTRDGAVNLVRPQGGTLGGQVSPVAVRAFTALSNGADQYDEAAYTLTFTLTDPETGRSHELTVQGQFDGAVTSDRVSLGNTFTGGSGAQSFDFLGNDYTVTFGFGGPGGPTRTWSGELTASVAVSGDAAPAVSSSAVAAPAADAPEPGSLALVVLALPAAAGLARRLRGR